MPNQLPDINQFVQQSQQPQQQLPDINNFVKQQPSLASNITAGAINPNLTPNQQLVADVNPLNPESVVGSYVTGTEHGVMSMATTLQKFISKHTAPVMRKLGVPEQYIQTPESAQQSYNDLSKDYNKAWEAHPTLAGLGNITGLIAGTTAIPMASAKSIYAPIANWVGGTAGKVLGAGVATAGMSAQGALSGGLLTSEGQDPNSLFNKPMARTGAIIGASTVPIEALARTYASNAQSLQDAQNAMTVKVGDKTVQYNGQTFLSDIKNNYSTKAANLVYDGTFRGSNRFQQTVAAKQYVQDYINGLSTITEGQPREQIASAVTQFNKMLSSDRSKIFNDTYNYLDKNVGAIPLSQETKTLYSELAQSHPELVKHNILPAENISDNLMASELKDIKGDIYKEGESILKGSPQTADRYYAMDLQRLSNSIRQDMVNAMQSNPAALEKFEHANAFDEGFRMWTDPKQSNQLINAIQNINSDKDGITKFINFLTSSKNPNTINKYLDVIGDKGKAALQQQQLTELFNKNIDTVGRFDIAGFTAGLDKISNSPQSIIMKDSLDALKGLTKYVLRPNIQSQIDRSGQGTVENTLLHWGTAASAGLAAGALTGSVGTGALAGAGALASLYTMAKISASSPLKNMLINMSKSVSPSVEQYLNGKISDQLGKMGLYLNQMENGGVEIKDKQREAQQVSLNDNEEGVIPGYMRLPQQTAPVKQNKIFKV